VAFHAERFPNEQHLGLASLTRRQVSRFQVSAWKVDAEFTSVSMSPVICGEHFALNRAGKLLCMRFFGAAKLRDCCA